MSYGLRVEKSDEQGTDEVAETYLQLATDHTIAKRDEGDVQCTMGVKKDAIHMRCQG
jgi:hypothetical protein